MKKYIFQLICLVLIASCSTGIYFVLPGTDLIKNNVKEVNKIDIDGTEFLYGEKRYQSSLFVKSFIFDMPASMKDMYCGGNENSSIDYMARLYCSYTDHGVYPRDEDLNKICRLDNSDSELYSRSGLVSYDSNITFSCLDKNVMGEKINYAISTFSKTKSSTAPKTRDISINDLKIQSFTLNLPKNSTQNCEDTYEFFWFDGPVNPDTPEIIDRILKEIKVCKTLDGKSLPVSIIMSSGGGYLKDGFETGEILRKYNTFSIIQKGEFCASSCAIAYLGANKRSIFGDGQIMFHAPYSYDIAALEKGKVEIECQYENEKLQKYYIEMLGNEDGELLYKRTMSYCGIEASWSLNKDAAKILGITNS